MQALARAGCSAGEPILDRRMHVFVPVIEHELALRGGAEDLAQGLTHPGVLWGRDQPRRAKSLDVTEASYHIPGHEASIPRPIVARGVLEDALVWRAGAPEGRPVHSLVSRQVSTHELAIEASSRGDLRDIDVLISRVRPPARARSALDGVPLTKEDPVRAGRTAEVFRI